MTTELKVFSDYLQIELLDVDAETELADHWVDAGNPLSDHLALAEDAVAIATGINGYVTVVVDVTDGPPADDRHAFEHVVECGIRTPTGRLRLTSPTYGEDDGDVIEVPAGWLRLRISLTMSPFDGEDRESPDPPLVRIQCWPAPPQDPVLVKGWDPTTARQIS